MFSRSDHYRCREYFVEDRLDSLEQGKLADMIILDKDPLTVSNQNGEEVYAAS